MGPAVLRILGASEPSCCLLTDARTEMVAVSPCIARGWDRSRAKEAGLPEWFFPLLGYVPSQEHHFTALCICRDHIRFAICPIVAGTVKWVHKQDGCPECDWLKSWLEHPK